MLGQVLCKLSVVALLAVGTAVHAAEKQIELKFSARSHLGREYTEADFTGRRFMVVAFLGTECPLAKLYGSRLAELHEALEGKGVAFVGVNSNRQDSMTELTAYATRYGIKFPLLKDTGNRIADLFAAERTPEAFVLDQQGNVLYHGRIDDQYGVGYSRDKAQRHDLKEALTELLAGKSVSVPQTEVVGCHIGRTSKVEPTGDVTYSKQIARILNKRCVECHRDGEIAPFPLTKYEDVLGWEDTILEVIADNRMPPWFANPKHGQFSNDARLTSEEKKLIETWIENGLPEGDTAELPPAPRFAEGWRISEPDQVFYMRDEAFQVPASGVVDYKHFIVDPGWDEDKYISAAEARPDNKSVVHHILVYILPPKEADQGHRNPRLDYILVGYAPGSTPVDLDPGVALKVPAGSKLMFQMHYTPNGYAQEDRSYAGVKFMDEKDVKQEIRGRLAINNRFRIPPGADNHIVEASFPLRNDELLVAMTPHMHLRGKSFRYVAKYPDGKQEVLLDVPQYDFNWQLKYILKQPKLLPEGTTIHCTAAFDNSERNLVNPNPDKTVRWGDQSFEEMMIGFFDTIPQQTKARESSPSLDPSGRYSWNEPLPGKLTLRMKDRVISGSLSAFGRKLPLQGVYMKDDQIRFWVESPDRKGLKFDFDAKVTLDGMDGTLTMAADQVGYRKEQAWKATKE